LIKPAPQEKDSQENNNKEQKISLWGNTGGGIEIEIYNGECAGNKGGIDD